MSELWSASVLPGEHPRIVDVVMRVAPVVLRHPKLDAVALWLRGVDAGCFHFDPGRSGTSVLARQERAGDGGFELIYELSVPAIPPSAFRVLLGLGQGASRCRAEPAAASMSIVERAAGEAERVHAADLVAAPRPAVPFATTLADCGDPRDFLSVLVEFAQPTDKALRARVKTLFTDWAAMLTLEGFAFGGELPWSGGVLERVTVALEDEMCAAMRDVRCTDEAWNALLNALWDLHTRTAPVVRVTSF